MKSPLKTLPFLTLLTLVFFAITDLSLAWEGFDQEKNSDIEIPPGNLVRENLIIEFYDEEELHMGRVIEMNIDASGTELVIEDLNEDNQERIFIMR